MKKCHFLAAALLLFVPVVSLGQSPASPDDVAERMNRQDADIQALREEVKRLREETVRLPAVATTPAGMAPAADAVAPAPAPADAGVIVPETARVKAGEGNFFSLDELRGEMTKFSWKKGDFAVTPYGYLWGNSVYSTERTSPGSYTLYVQSASTTPESEFIVDVRNTRLGFDVLGPKIPCLGCAESGGKVEVDFQNSVLTTENKPTIMLRHAYCEVKDEDFRILVGQTWDVISPLNPDMLLYSVGWDAGNIGYRRAQFRYERYLNFSDVSLVTVQSSINQDVFPDTITGATGEPSNWPIVEGRVAWTVGRRGQGCLPITVGLSGHIGEDEFDSTVLGRDNRRRTWSGDLDVRVPLNECWGVEGECYIGENLSPFLGGIGQGIDPLTGNTIRDAGGWFEVWYDCTPKLHSHVGYSVDQPNNHDLTAATERSYNQFYFGNLIYDVTKNLLVGVEVSSWKTLYVGELPGDSVRTEFVAKYGF
ncbi:MAG: hypothetical protein WCB27_26295 [Thermoguttaceae bacterium]